MSPDSLIKFPNTVFSGTIYAYEYTKEIIRIITTMTDREKVV